jgi:hypothetical protein
MRFRAHASSRRLLALTLCAAASFLVPAEVALPFGPLGAEAFAQGSSAMVVNLIGSGTYERGGKKSPLHKGTLLLASDVISIAPKSAVKIQFEDGSATTLFESTDLVLENAKLRQDGGLEATVNVIKGKVRFFVKPKSAGNAVKFKTSNAIMGVRGTSGVIVSQGERSELFVTSGRVEVVASGIANAIAVPVGPGFSTLVLRNAAPTPPKAFDATALASDPFPADTAPELEPSSPSPTQEEKEPDSPQEESGGGNSPRTDSPSSPQEPEPTGELSAPSSKTLYSPDGSSGVVVRGGDVEAIVPASLPFLDSPVDASVRQSPEFARGAGLEAGLAVEQVARDTLERAQGASPPSPRRRIPVDVRVEGWK